MQYREPYERADEEMRKEEIRREDGRYLIYYWFDDEPLEGDEPVAAVDTVEKVPHAEAPHHHR